MTKRSSRILKSSGLSAFYVMASWTTAITTLTPLRSDTVEGRSSVHAEPFPSHMIAHRAGYARGGILQMSHCTSLSPPFCMSSTSGLLLTKTDSPSRSDTSKRMGSSRKCWFGLSRVALQTYTLTVIRYPRDCRCAIKPRSIGAASLVFGA